MRKKWAKPRLIVLVKGKNDENVLDACKFSTIRGPEGTPIINACVSSVAYYDECMFYLGLPSYCQQCNAYSAS